MTIGISVIIPHYNAEKYIGEAVRSIAAQVGLEIPALEVIVIDDGSTEESWERAQKATVSFGRTWHVRFTKNRGQGFALNDGVIRSSGELLAFLDADDLWEPQKLALQLEALRAPGKPDLVLGHAREFRDDGWLGPAVPAPLVSAFLLRRETFERVGPFEEGLGAGMTLEWYSRALDKGLSTRMLAETVYRRRLHDQNYGVVHRDRAVAEYLTALKIVTDRRRNANAEAK